MAAFIVECSESCSPETAAARSGGEQSSSRYENVASSVPPSCRPCPEALLLHRLSSPRASVFSPPQSPSGLSGHSRARALSLSRPVGCFARAKDFYEKSPLRHFGPWLLLLLYALLGALLFFWLEADNERRLLGKERAQLERLRQETLQRLARAGRNQRQVLLQFERDLARTKLPDALEWDYWGALFYVGTVFTTIGYGNITPRTTTGQALSIVYAIVGIPLVLTLLNQTSKRMTRWLSHKWISYRQRVRSQVRRARGQREAEEGGKEPAAAEEEQTTESRTIPVWLALSLVLSYVCTIAAIFLVWESRWSYFTSFYFICISCLTIGLGDVIPDHPHMLILMFVFVILGLSFVSMLISVIQIKMEEWLYRMLMRMQKEYQKALESVSDPVERERILTQLLAQEPWYMRSLAPLCVSGKEAAKLDALANQIERVWLPTNTRAIQTEKEEEKEEATGEEEPVAEAVSGAGTELRTALEQPASQHLISGGPLSRSDSFRSANSVSDATSLPMDPASVVGHQMPSNRPSREVQTEAKPPLVDACVGSQSAVTKSQGTQLRAATSNKRVDTDGLLERADSGVGTEPRSSQCRHVQTQGGRGSRGRLARADSFEVDVVHQASQCSPPALRHVQAQTSVDEEQMGEEIDQEEPTAVSDEIDTIEGPSEQRERSESVQVVVGDEMDDLLDLAYPGRRPEKKDLVIQTDDSYLRIARRLDNLRTAKSEINVYCTGVGVPKHTGRRKSLRFLEPARDMIRDSLRRHGGGGGQKTAAAEEQQQQQQPGPSQQQPQRMDAEQMEQQQPSPPNRPVARRKKQVRLPPEEADGE